jgi:hypothetical protein
MVRRPGCARARIASSTEQLRLGRRGGAHVDGGADDAGLAAALGHLGEEHGAARVDQGRVEVGVLAGRPGQVPGVDQHVHERTGDGLADRPLEAERGGAGPLERTGVRQPLEDGGDAGPVVRRGRPGGGDGCPAVHRGQQVLGAADHVVEQRLDVPLAARRGQPELFGGDALGHLDRPAGRRAVEVDGVRGSLLIKHLLNLGSA